MPCVRTASSTPAWRGLGISMSSMVVVVEQPVCCKRTGCAQRAGSGLNRIAFCRRGCDYKRTQANNNSTETNYPAGMERAGAHHHADANICSRPTPAKRPPWPCMPTQVDVLVVGGGINGAGIVA